MWERVRKAVDGLAWLAGAIGGAVLLTLPLWFILLGLI